ncbi:MAG TPA: hypothetical protein VLY04_01150 [Bryobacteraceae bacterium]|nr:hypothetical protein [Bryobacteraceae bacterium]
MLGGKGGEWIRGCPFRAGGSRLATEFEDAIDQYVLRLHRPATGNRYLLVVAVSHP